MSQLFDPGRDRSLSDARGLCDMSGPHTPSGRNGLGAPTRTTLGPRGVTITRTVNAVFPVSSPTCDRGRALD